MEFVETEPDNYFLMKPLEAEIDENNQPIIKEFTIPTEAKTPCSLKFKIMDGKTKWKLMYSR